MLVRTFSTPSPPVNPAGWVKAGELARPMSVCANCGETTGSSLPARASKPQHHITGLVAPLSTGGPKSRGGRHAAAASRPEASSPPAPQGCQAAGGLYSPSERQQRHHVQLVTAKECTIGTVGAGGCAPSSPTCRESATSGAFRSLVAAIGSTNGILGVGECIPSILKCPEGATSGATRSLVAAIGCTNGNVGAG